MVLSKTQERSEIPEMSKKVACPKCGGTGLCVVMLPPLGLTHVICGVCGGSGYIEVES